MLKQPIYIDFCDFWFNFPKTDNFYYNTLRERFDVRIADDPDFLLYGPYGHSHRLHSGVRIFVSQESAPPDFEVCDYSVTCLKLDDPRHLQLPTYVTYGRATDIIKKDDEPERLLAGKSRFCSFIVSGHHPRKNANRAEFFVRLNERKRVDSGGRFMNNIGGPIPGYSGGKIDFLRTCKFNIAFENAALPGYTTEKIFEPMVARCLPIYWGNPLIAEEFNPRSFLNYSDFPGPDALIEKILALDRDDAQYLEYLRQPYFHNDESNRYFNHDRYLDFFEKVFFEKITPVAQGRARKWFFLGRWTPTKRHHQHPLPGTFSRPGPEGGS